MITLRPWTVLAGGILVLAAVAALIWVSIPGPDTRADLVSPSGAARLELGEICDGSTCRRAVIFERSDNGASERRACAIDIPGGEPAFTGLEANWSADETDVRVSYDGAGGGEVAFRFEDCQTSAD